jgi:glycosyltransferase involved in cell wall biosynthesis
MVGPGQGLMGGISALVDTLCPFLQRRVDLSYLATVHRRETKESGRISMKNSVSALSQYARFLWAVLRKHPQIIHLHTSQGVGWLKDTFFIVVAKMLGCRIILHMHGGDFDHIYGRSPRVIQKYTRKIMKQVDSLIAVSGEWKNRLKHIFPDIHILCLKNCINVDAISPAHASRSTNGVKALFLGLVGTSKGAFDLLEALSLLKSSHTSIHLTFAGPEEREGDLLRAEKKVKELALERVCRVVGPVYGAEKSELLSESGLFVLPSYKECLPMAILEAMAAGMPVVATPVGGIPEVVREGVNGFLIAAGDVLALAEKLALLAGNPDLREAMGRRSREFAEQELDVKSYIKRLVELYESLAVSGGRTCTSWC